MELLFENLLYSSESLKKPAGTIIDSQKEFYPGEDSLTDAEEYVIRYNSKGNFSYGRISGKDSSKMVIAITKKAGLPDKYVYKIVAVDEKMMKGSWSLQKDDSLQEYEETALNAILSGLGKGDADGR